MSKPITSSRLDDCPEVRPHLLAAQPAGNVSSNSRGVKSEEECDVKRGRVSKSSSLKKNT
jgi:hypothetical protein